MKNIENAKQPYETFDVGDNNWIAESWDEDDGALLRAIFIGPRARERAEQYRGAKNIDIIREKDTVRPR